MSQTIFWAKIRKKRVYLLPKVKPHLPNNPKFVRLANTICASSQNRIWRSPGQIEDLKFTKSVSELRQAGLSHTKLKKWTCFEAICFFEPFKMTRRNDEICENPRKSSEILDRYPTKIQKKSRFEHVQVTLSEKAWFSRPDRFWSRQGNVLQPVPKFHGFSSENCSDPY